MANEEQRREVLERGGWLEGGKLFPLNVPATQVAEIYGEVRD